MKKIKINELPNIVYHGTTSNDLISLLNGIDLGKCNENTDFGKGFYTTSDYQQAFSFAKYQTNRYNGKQLKYSELYDDYEPFYAYPLVVTYGVNLKKLKEFKHIIFTDSDDKWKIFVYNNRKGLSEIISNYHNLYCVYDFVYGKVADSLKEMGNTNDYKCIKAQFSDQLSFHTESVKQCLKRIDYRIHWSDKYEQYKGRK